MSLVSVIMPMRNAERYVRAAIESVLVQAGVELEVVVVDDGSTDNSSGVVQAIGDPRIRVVPGPRQGISAARNAGLAAARGSIIAWCDADDLYPPGRLAQQVRWLDEHPEFVAVRGRFQTIAPSGQLVTEMDCGTAVALEITTELLEGHTRTHLGTYAMRTDALRQAGGFRSFFLTAEDLDAQLRLAEAGRVWFEPVVCYQYRLHDASVTHSQSNRRRTFFEETARRFAAQRRSAGKDDLQQGNAPPVPVDDGQSTPALGAAEQMQGMLLGQAWEEHQAGRKLRTLATGLKACWTRPVQVAAWKSLAALALKRTPRGAEKQ